MLNVIRNVLFPRTLYLLVKLSESATVWIEFVPQLAF